MTSLPIMRYAVLLSLVGTCFFLPLYYVEKNWTAVAFSIFNVLLSSYLIGGWIAVHQGEQND